MSREGRASTPDGCHAIAHRDKKMGAAGGKCCEFEEAFRARVRAAREAHGFTQADVARALAISLWAYRRYETGGLLPHHLVGEFAEITGIDIADLYSPPRRR
jgi:ribosome-binding protein aMBF1 (putative translation factor)